MSPTITAKLKYPKNITKNEYIETMVSAEMANTEALLQKLITGSALNNIFGVLCGCSGLFLIEFLITKLKVTETRKSKAAKSITIKSKT